MGKLRGKNKARDRKNEKKIKDIRHNKYIKSLSDKILTFDAPELTAVCEEVADKKDLVVNGKDIIKELKKVVCSTKTGVGLAANQLGYNKRVFVIREIENGANILKAFINPEILKENDVKLSSREGCLSYPGFFCDVDRSWKIEVKYLDEKFESKKEELIGMTARIFLHEFDHLFGKCAVGEKYKEENNQPILAESSTQ